MKKYIPEPVDTVDVVLPEVTADLAESLARNAHDVWAKRKMEEGWKPGDALDPDRMLHPDLIPYEELSEAKKQYDRDMALGTLRLIVKNDYVIEKPGVYRVGEDPALVRLSGILREERDPDLDRVLQLWRLRDQTMQPTSREAHELLGDLLIKRGQPILAYNVLSEGADPEKTGIRQRQLMALALIRSGAPHEAGIILKSLGEDQRDEETLGLRASVLKSQWEQSTDPVAKDSFLAGAVAAYKEAFDETGGYWTGINAATLFLVKGDRARARDLADRVHGMCMAKLPGSEDERFWLLATLGEACLVLERWLEAWDWYAKAAASGKGKASLGDLSKTRRNAILILQAYGSDPGDMLQKYLPMPGVVVFTGHMIDRPDRSVPRFPSALENAVRREIEAKLEQSGCRIGYASAACGSDLIFHESIRKLGGESHVVLPYDEGPFLADCVSYPAEGDWAARFASVLDDAVDVFAVSQHGPVRGGLNYRYTNSILDGHAKIMAGQLGTTLTRLVVWDGRQGDGPGGTHDLVTTWREQGHQVIVIDTRALLDREIPEVPRKTASPIIPRAPIAPAAQAGSSRIMSMLFADAKGFSKLSEDQVALFVEEFMGSIAMLVKASPNAPVFGNTWGDGIFLVFDGVRAAGLFALELCELVAGIDWSERGLPDDMGIRIGLHAGPVSVHFDHIMGREGYYGTHISRAARIEPITPPGQVYASQQFAALAASGGVADFVCEYKGETQMAKKYGAFPTFHVRRLHPKSDTAGHVGERSVG